MNKRNLILRNRTKRETNNQIKRVNKYANKHTNGTNQTCIKKKKQTKKLQA